MTDPLIDYAIGVMAEEVDPDYAQYYGLRADLAKAVLHTPSFDWPVPIDAASVADLWDAMSGVDFRVRRPGKDQVVTSAERAAWRSEIETQQASIDAERLAFTTEVTDNRRAIEDDREALANDRAAWRKERADLQDEVLALTDQRQELTQETKDLQAAVDDLLEAKAQAVAELTAAEARVSTANDNLVAIKAALNAARPDDVLTVDG